MILRTGNNIRFWVLGSRFLPRTQNLEPKTQRSFTLIELMISVAILGFGLVIVSQSYIISAGALNASQNYISATQLARDKLAELELVSYERKGLTPGLESDSGTRKIGPRNFNWLSEVKEVSSPDYLTEKLVEVCIRVDWTEAGRTKDAWVSTYLPRKQEEKQNEQK